jgi:hypothetical protein
MPSWSSEMQQTMAPCWQVGSYFFVGLSCLADDGEAVVAFYVVISCPCAPALMGLALVPMGEGVYDSFIK